MVMSYPPIKIIRPGQIDWDTGKDTKGLAFRLRNWEMDMGGRKGDIGLWRNDIVIAVRDYTNKRCANLLGEGVKITPKEKPTEPISIAIEREAEMETFMLINRCQGAG